MTTVAWIVNGSPIDADYTQSYSNVRFYYQTIVEVCRRIKPKYLYLIGLKESKRTEIKEGGDCSYLRDLLKKKAPGTKLEIKDWDSGKLPSNFDLGFSAAMWGKKSDFKNILPRLLCILNQCDQFVYLDSDHELATSTDWMIWTDMFHFMKYASENKAIRRRITEVWATEGPPDYLDTLGDAKYEGLYCPYLSYPIKKVPLSEGALDWVFIKNPLTWEGKIEKFLRTEGKRCKWYLSPMPGKATKELKFLDKFGVNTARAKFWKIHEVTPVLAEGVMTFHMSRPVNRFSSKMAEGLRGGVVTTIPKLRHGMLGDYFYHIYKSYLEAFDEVLVNCRDLDNLNEVMSRRISTSHRKAMYETQLLFHNEYFNPTNIELIGSRVVK